MKTQKEFFQFLTKDLEEKILVEHLVLERLNVLISQAGTLSEIYKNIREEQKEIKHLLNRIGPLIASYKKFQKHLKEHERRNRK